MARDLQTRFFAVFLALLSVAAIVFAWINFQKEREFSAPYDGVWWVEDGGHLRAARVDVDGPGQKAGIKLGDHLVAVDGRNVSNVGSLERQLYRVGVWSKATYSLVRQGVSLEAPLILVPADRSLYGGLRLIALVYLGIGMYVLLRRWTAPKSTHFYVFCLVSFIFYSFHYTGKLNDFDWIIYWSNVVAWLLQPALFLHFSLTFPERKGLVNRRPWLIPAVYVPGAILLIAHICVLELLQPSELLRWNLDRVQMSYLAAYFVMSAGVLWHSYRHAESAILRQQMKWVTRGTILAVAPFTLFYVIPYLLGSPPTLGMKVSVLSLVFLPLTFGYAIFRYRLMDVDLIFKRGMAYTIAAGAITGAYFAAVGMASVLFHQNFPSVGPIGLVVAIAVTALLFDPFKNWVQDYLDKFFYRKRYDYRKTLTEFGRDLNSETDLDKMLTSIVDRLSRTLLVDRLAIFLSDPEQPEQFSLAKSYGISNTSGLDFDFLHVERPEWQVGHLFFDNTNQAVRETRSARETIRRLELNYYIPCTVMNRMIAVLGLGKTSEGDFLSSEDVQLLETLAGYIGIAVQNARLYKSLEQKAGQYERLKEFNENIVESISVGVLAVDLEDRIESWNSQMEVMYALPRLQALGRPLGEVMAPVVSGRVLPCAPDSGHSQPVQVPPGHDRRRHSRRQHRHRPAGHERFQRDWPADHRGRHHRAHRAGIAALAGREAVLHRPARRRSRARSQYSAGRHLVLRADAGQAGSRRREAVWLLDKITRQTFRASEIVNSLLNFSRTSSTEFSNVDLNRVIQDTLTLLDHQFKTARIKVQPDLQAELPPIYGNTGKLQQVFLNLFLNAKDAMPAGGTLTISTSNGHHVQVQGRRYRHRHCAGTYPSHLRSILHHEEQTQDRTQRWHGFGTVGDLRHHPGTCRQDSCRQRARSRHDIHHGISHGEKGGQCLK